MDDPLRKQNNKILKDLLKIQSHTNYIIIYTYCLYYVKYEIKR